MFYILFYKCYNKKDLFNEGGCMTMKLNNKGFSILEMFAVIFVSTLIIFPLITTLVNNIEINDREQKRRSASNIAKGTLDGLNRFTFTDIETLINNANSSSQYYIELNKDNCTVLRSEDELLCDQLFASIWNNVSFEASEFRVFIMNYNLPQSYIDSLVVNASIPDGVKTIIGNYTADSTANPELYKVIIWIEYDIEDNRTLTQEGLISNE